MARKVRIRVINGEGNEIMGESWNDIPDGHIAVDVIYTPEGFGGRVAVSVGPLENTKSPNAKPPEPAKVLKLVPDDDGKKGA